MGRLLWRNGHLYFGALNSKLDRLEIERYFSALIIIEDEYPNTSQQEIADRLGVNKVVMVRILNYLTQHGYIIRETDKTDRRKHRIVLTNKALNRMPEIHRAVDELNDLCSKNVCSDDWNTFLNVLKQVHTNLSALPSRELIVHIRSKKNNVHSKSKKRS